MLNLKSLDPYQASVSEKFAFNDHKKGTQRSQFTKLKFNSISNAGGQCTIYSKSTDSLIDKRMYIQLKVRVSDDGEQPGRLNGATTAAYNAGTAPRAFPVNSLIQNASVSINGANISTQSSDLIYAFQRCTAMPDDMRYYSTTPCQLDPGASLEDFPKLKVYRGMVDAATAPARAGGAVNVYYAVENPQSPFLRDDVALSNGLGCSAMDSILPRGCFPFADDAGNTYREFVFTEPLLHGLLADGDEVGAYCNVNRIDITLNFHSGVTAYNKIMSHCLATAGSANGDNMSVTVTEANVLYREMSPTVPLPSVFRDNFPQYMVQRQAVPTAAAENVDLDTVNFSNIVYNTHPSKLYIFIKPRDGSHISKIGTCFSIPKNINLTVGTNSGLLSGLDTEGLYLLSLDNGLKQCNFQQYSKFLGGPIIIDTAKDLGLTPGRKEQLNISFSLSSKAPVRINGNAGAGGNVLWECVCISVMPSTLEISKDRCYVYEGFDMQAEQEAEINEANVEPSIAITEQVSGAGMKGGAFDYKKMLDIGKKALKVGATLSKAAQSSGVLPPGMAQAAAALNMADASINKGSGFQPRGLSGAGRLGAGRLLQ